MALQEILRQVEQAGRGEADAITTATRTEAEGILSEGKAEGKQVANAITAAGKQQAEQLERQELPAAELAGAICEASEQFELGNRQAPDDKTVVVIRAEREA